jgi:CheY-like chemotaxis protein
MRILFADDSPTIRIAVARLLEESGHEVILAADGVEAITSFFEDRPDLVLLDLYMPRLTGWVACRVIKDDPVGERVPVLVMTGMDEPEGRFWAEESGADAVLAKDEIGPGLLAKIHALSATRALAELSGPSPPDFNGEPQDVLARVCDVLDRKLFESTVVNEIAAIGIRGLDLSDSTAHMLASLHRLVGYDVGAFALTGERRMIVNLARRISGEALEDFEATALRRLNELAAAALELTEIDITVVGTGAVDESVPALQWQSLHVQPLVARGRLLGLVCLAAADVAVFEGSAHRTLRTVGPALAAVVDGCRRVTRPETVAG